MNIHGTHSYWKQGALGAAGVRRVWAGAGPQCAGTGAGAYRGASHTACFSGQHHCFTSINSRCLLCSRGLIIAVLTQEMSLNYVHKVLYLQLKFVLWYGEAFTVYGYVRIWGFLRNWTVVIESNWPGSLIWIYMHSAHKMTGRSLETCSAITVLSPKNVGILHETVFVWCARVVSDWSLRACCASSTVDRHLESTRPPPCVCVHLAFVWFNKTWIVTDCCSCWVWFTRWLIMLWLHHVSCIRLVDVCRAVGCKWSFPCSWQFSFAMDDCGIYK